MSRSFFLTPSVDRVEMNHKVRPSGVNHGSASTPSPAIGASAGADQPPGPQRLTLIRHPLNCGVERTNHRPPVRGSNAGCDSNWSEEIGGRDDTTSTARSDD